MKRKSILILGTGNAQTDFIKYCKLEGFETHACSYKAEGRGIQEADFFKVINITDIDSISDYASKNNIGLIYSTGSDLAMPTVTKASKSLGLPCFIQPETAVICNNKTLLRDALKALPNFSVESLNIKTESDLNQWEKFPAIVKPADSQGQRGIRVVKYEKELLPAFANAKSYSLTNTAIIEEYIEGFEISINLYILNGEIELLFVTERISFNEYPGGIIKSHIYPCTKKIDKDKLLEMSKEVINILNIQNGPAYFQVKIDELGQPKIIEVTPRLDGCHLWRLIKEMKGINLFKLLLNHLSNGDLSKEDFLQKELDKDVRAELSFFTSPPNTIFNTNHHQPANNPTYTEWYYKTGEVVRPINQFAEKTGYQIVFQK